MKDIVVHTVNISHYRLVELSKLADQAKPFYDWVEKYAKRITGSHRSLNEILMSCSKDDIKRIIDSCHFDENEEKPLLFDGVGRVYRHSKACFYFFAWIIRDAPQQRLSPLITRMQKAENIEKVVAETDSLAELIFEYRPIVKSFDWQVVREIVIDRLEGSRRSISGHHLEAYVRTGLVTAIQNYYSIYESYGQYKKIKIADKQIRIGKHTIDVAVELFPKIGKEKVFLLVPVKTRETEGGGHSHLFTRDVITAINDIKKTIQNYHIVVIIIAENWSVSEIEAIDNQIDMVFHFNMNPNKFTGFDEDSQIRLNRYIESVLKRRGKE